MWSFPCLLLESYRHSVHFIDRAKRRWVGDDLQAHGGKIIKMGSAELTRLWNINPDNMEACKAEKRSEIITNIKITFHSNA